MHPPSIYRYSVWLLPIGWTAAIFLLLTRKVHRHVPGWLPPWADKPVHMCLFGSLAVLTFIAFRYGSSVRLKRAALIAWAYAALYGGLTEWYQFHIPWRTGEWLDVAANLLGAGVVFLLYALWPVRSA